MIVATEGGPGVGAGHVMRCIALAEACRERGAPVRFDVSRISPELRELIAGHGFELVEGLPRTTAPEPVVLDGYGFSPDDHEAARTAGHPVLVVDDFAHLPVYAADILLNQNVDAEGLPYAVGPSTRLLLGPRYALLRREFVAAPRSDEIRDPARRVLLTLGGVPRQDLLRELERAIAGIAAEVRVADGTTPMPELMRWADVAVSASGSTSYELAYMGVPAVLVPLADNQERIAAGLDRRGVAVRAAPETEREALALLIKDAPRRREMRERGRALVDGRGANRVATIIASA